MDRAALQERFGAALQVTALPAPNAIEGRTRQGVLLALQQATRNCQVSYTKGRVSFEVLGTLSPDVLRENLPAFARVVRILDQRL